MSDAEKKVKNIKNVLTITTYDDNTIDIDGLLPDINEMLKKMRVVEDAAITNTMNMVSKISEDRGYKKGMEGRNEGSKIITL